MLKKLLLLPVLTLALAFYQTAFAGSCHQRMDQMMGSLNLTDAQKTQIKTITEQSREAMQTNMTQMKTLQGQIKDLITSEKVDEAKLNDLISQKTSLMATMMKSKIMVKNQIYNVLDSKQQQQFKDLMTQWEQNKMQHKTGC
ncbi:Spy/CpxP family protein refolding chaperone [Legionella dresdenensis]|uniref:Spy/CpxP family protein refolding chaperone n=1 Tax=Legionella dresdenensis TaxID=450200 RepID=A0ABV8CHF2_9GAMM